jgi:hypothetical protein
MIETRLLTVAACALLIACGSATSPSRRDISGQWSGTTSQGSPISFTVSADEKVTTITVGHSFNGCSGTQTFPNLSVNTAPEVICVPGPCAPSVQSYRSFSYSNGRIEGPMTTINGLFLLDRVDGQVKFWEFPSCGSTQATWSATRR